MLCILRSRRFCLFSGVISLCVYACVRVCCSRQCTAVQRDAAPLNTVWWCCFIIPKPVEKETFSRNRSTHFNGVISGCVSVNLELAKENMPQINTLFRADGLES